MREKVIKAIKCPSALNFSLLQIKVESIMLERGFFIAPVRPLWWPPSISSLITLGKRRVHRPRVLLSTYMTLWLDSFFHFSLQLIFTQITRAQLNFILHWRLHVHSCVWFYCLWVSFLFLSLILSAQLQTNTMHVPSRIEFIMMSRSIVERGCINMWGDYNEYDSKLTLMMLMSAFALATMLSMKESHI